MASIAFIGLGNMGRPMARNLVKAGHEVIGFDILAANMAAAAGDGVACVDSVRAAASRAEIVLTMLPAGPQVREVYLGAADGVFASARADTLRSEEHTSELQSLMRISYAVFCLKKK